MSCQLSVLEVMQHLFALRLSDDTYAKFIEGITDASQQIELGNRITTGEVRAAEEQELERRTAPPGLALELDPAERIAAASPSVKFRDQMKDLGISYTDSGALDLSKQPSKNEIIDGIMGKLPATVLNKKQEFDIKGALNRTLGIADTKRIATQLAANTIGISKDQLNALIVDTDKLEFQNAPENVQISVLQTRAQELADKEITLNIEKLKTTLEKEKELLRTAKDLNKPIEKDITILDPLDNQQSITFRAGSITRAQVDGVIDTHIKIAQLARESIGSLSGADFNKVRSVATNSVLDVAESFTSVNLGKPLLNANGDAVAFEFDPDANQGSKTWLINSQVDATKLGDSIQKSFKDFVVMQERVNEGSQIILLKNAIDAVNLYMQNNEYDFTKDEDIKDSLTAILRVKDGSLFNEVKNYVKAFNKNEDDKDAFTNAYKDYLAGNITLGQFKEKTPLTNASDNNVNNTNVSGNNNNLGLNPNKLNTISGEIGNIENFPTLQKRDKLSKVKDILRENKIATTEKINEIMANLEEKVEVGRDYSIRNIQNIVRNSLESLQEEK